MRDGSPGQHVRRARAPRRPRRGSHPLNRHRTTIRRPRHATGGGLQPADRRSRQPIDAIVVTVPARNESAAIAACLRSLDRAAACCPVPVLLVVAADSCRDDTAARAAAVPLQTARRHVLSGTWRGASAARAAATQAGLERIGTRPGAVWFASTDADCTVPGAWLAGQLAAAGRGVDAVAGTVRLARTAPPALRAAFAATYATAGRRHDHVHAANLGVRASAHLDVGGWRRATVLGEDHDLWHRLLAAGYRLEQPVRPAVTTSHRTRGRVTGGFATRMATLVRQADEASA